ncbi:MAG TPA: DUF4230 domain-containing protein [Thermoanaerobaculia bacterium]|jgi:hypothetical protein
MQRKPILIAAAIVAAALLVTIGAAVMTWRAAKRTVVRQVLTPQERTVDLAAVVTQVRELNRLETATMRVVHVGTIKQSYTLVPNAVAGDEITFLATGDVIAGIDLAHLQPADVWRSPDGTVNVRMPRAEVLVTRVDNQQSRVINRKTGMLRRADVDLETRARQHAEENIRSEAIQKGVLNIAQASAEKKMAELFRTLGVERVRFVGTSLPVPNTER